MINLVNHRPDIIDKRPASSETPLVKPAQYIAEQISDTYKHIHTHTHTSTNVPIFLIS